MAAPMKANPPMSAPMPDQTLYHSRPSVPNTCPTPITITSLDGASASVPTWEGASNASVGGPLPGRHGPHPLGELRDHEGGQNSGDHARDGGHRVPGLGGPKVMDEPAPWCTGSPGWSRKPHTGWL